MRIIDPIEFAKVGWPSTYFFDKQCEIISSVERNTITVVPACNKVGKDFVAGHIAVSHYVRYPECRVICTSIRDDHLRVLFGEIERHIETCRFPLKWPKGLLKIKHRDIRKVVKGEQCRISYLRGIVSERPEGFAGHHARHTLAIIDEASGVQDEVLEQCLTWAKRILIIGNPLPCTNFFRKLVKAGNILAPSSN